MNVSIIIPNFNGEALLKENLTSILLSLQAYKGGNKEIIISDDRSTDGSINFLHKFRSQNNTTIKIVIVENKGLQGFASNVNNAVSYATGDILVLLNTDVIPNVDFLSPLIKHFSDENVFAVGCLEKSTENRQIRLYGRAIGVWQRGFLMHSSGSIDKFNTLWVSGGSGAFRKSIWDKLSGLKDVYNPFYWEDIDISYRALKRGYTLLFEPKSVVTHNHDTGVIKKSYSPFRIKTIVYRNQFIFTWLNLTDFDLKLLHILWLPYFFIKTIFNRDWAFIKGFFEAVCVLPHILRLRLIESKSGIKKDRDIVKSFVKG